jgi:hypothetical protein
MRQTSGASSLGLRPLGKTIAKAYPLHLVDWTDFIATVHLSHSDESTCQIAFSSNTLHEPPHSTYGYSTLHRYRNISSSQSNRPKDHLERPEPIPTVLPPPSPAGVGLENIPHDPSNDVLPRSRLKDVS